MESPAQRRDETNCEEITIAQTFGNIAPWTPLAFMAYLATTVLGLLSLRGRRIPRVWHSRMFMVTAVLTVLAAAPCYLAALVFWAFGPA